MGVGALAAFAGVLVSTVILLPAQGPAIPIAPPSVSFPAEGGPLVIESEPAGASVRLDDQDLGAAPVKLEALAAGRHHLQLTLEGYREWSEDIEVEAGRSVQSRAVLRPLPAKVAFSSSLRGARVWIDGKDRGAPPVSTELEPGEHAIRVEAEGLRPSEERVAVGPNESRSLFAAASGGEIALVPGDPSGGIAVMIDNQDDARPQYGLNRADVVYEAFAEGGITRYMALFLTQGAEQIGPIRSARHYFVNWASEYLAPLVHIGASPQGYQALASAPIPDVDGRAFYRAPNRPAPHDALTSSDMVQTELKSRPVSTFGGLHFRYEPREADQGIDAAGGLSFNYGAWPSAIRWTYDPETDEYTRSINQRTFPDAATGEPIVARNVVVLWMDSWLIPGDEAGRLDFQQVGSGRLLAFTDGVAIEGSWRRTAIRNVTEYRDELGTTLLLTPGSTWFQVVPSNVPVEILTAP
jgi:hypothetical protein